MKLGTVIYYLLWPAIWFYAPLRLRVSVVITCGNELLEVKNWLGPSKWQLPGGGLKHGETIESCALRESREELSMELSQSKPRALTDVALVVKQYGLLVRTHIVSIDVPNKPDIAINNELTDYRWVTIENSSINEQVKSLLKQG